MGVPHRWASEKPDWGRRVRWDWVERWIRRRRWDRFASSITFTTITASATMDIPLDSLGKRVVVRVLLVDQRQLVFMHRKRRMKEKEREEGRHTHLWDAGRPAAIVVGAVRVSDIIAGRATLVLRLILVLHICAMFLVVLLLVPATLAGLSMIRETLLLLIPRLLVVSTTRVEHWLEDLLLGRGHICACTQAFVCVRCPALHNAFCVRMRHRA